MDWLKQNPFFGLLALVTGVLVLAAGYFLFDAHNRFQAETATFEEQTRALEKLQSNEPFPDGENVRLGKEELDGARATLEQIGSNFEVEVPTTTPQGFQDLLREKVNDITARAAAHGVTLGEGFYLGFESYETQPPAAAAAGPLALQLESIHTVAGILVDAKVREITGFSRQPLAAEAGGGAPDVEERGQRGKRDRPAAPPAESNLPDLVLAPFDVKFTAEQSAFRTAFNRILQATPPVFVRLLGVTNTAPAGPSKSAPADESAESGTIKPVLGQELAVVDLRLATVSTGTPETE
jgi:hypothetical protein